MNFEDFDFNVKKPPKQGRRANLEPNTLNLDLESSREELHSAPRALRNGWASEDNKSFGERSIEIEKSDFDDDIPVIPDIEELQDDLGGGQEGQQSNVSGKKFTYKHLDSELLYLQQKNQFFGSNLNLGCLASKLLPEEEVLDPDVVWSMNDLFEKTINSKSEV